MAFATIFPDFSYKAYLLQLLNTAAGSKRQGLYCDHPPNSDALAFCPNCQKTALLTSAAPSYGRAGSSCDTKAVATVVEEGKNKKKLSGHQNSAELAERVSQSGGGSGQAAMNSLFLGLSVHHTLWGMLFINKFWAYYITAHCCILVFH